MAVAISAAVAPAEPSGVLAWRPEPVPRALP